MRAFASSFGAWKSIEEQEGTITQHGLTFPLAVVEAIGRPHGLEITPEESGADANSFDAIFLGVLDSRCMISAKKHFDSWRVPFRRAHRPIGKFPLVWAGGQGLRNPLPLSDVFDLCVVGDAEDPLPILLRLQSIHGNTSAFLSEAANVPGVFVPSVHDRNKDRISLSVSSDIGITLRNDIRVSNDGSRRIEIARGCKSKCLFCSLGWNVKHRENSTESIIEQISSGPKRIHLQAGDAEAHSGITAIRETLSTGGGIDLGWTGRYDSILDNPDQIIPGHKRYAFGVEGTSYRIRAAIGKSFLTDDYLVDGTAKLFKSVDGDGKGRLAWHLIAGLPTSGISDGRKMVDVIRRINNSVRGTARNLSIHWQPFQPLPGTPMQWCATGTGARTESVVLRSIERLPWCRVRQVYGRSDEMALLCSVLARSDERGALLLERMADGYVSADTAESITGAQYREIDVHSQLPWDFIDAPLSRSLRKAYDVFLDRIRNVHDL